MNHPISYLRSLTGKSLFPIKPFLILCLLFISFSSKCLSQGNLFVMPKRIVLEGRKRSAEINLANTGKDTATYAISFIQLRMKEDGTFENISQPDSGQFFADKNLRIFPHTVTLAPKEVQSIKIQIIKSEELQTGEYRSHLYFRAVDRNAPERDTLSRKDSSISFKIVPVFGISIPAIIRVGATSVNTEISNLSFKMAKDTLPVLNVQFNRSGNVSVYGEITVDHISPQGKITNVGKVKGFAIYTPNASRKFQLLLNKYNEVDYHSGKLHLIFQEQDAARPVRFAEGEVVLQ